MGRSWTAAGLIANPKANLGDDGLSYGFPTSRRSIDAILRRARLIWASKIAVELATRTGASVRSAEAWLAGDRSMNAGALVALLQSDQGIGFLDALIEDMPPPAQRRWRDEFERAARRADLRARREALEREIESETEGGTV